MVPLLLLLWAMAAQFQVASSYLMGRVVFGRPCVTKRCPPSTHWTQSKFATWQQREMQLYNENIAGYTLRYWNFLLHAAQNDNVNDSGATRSYSTGGSFSRGRFSTSTGNDSSSNIRRENNDNWQVPKSVDIPVEKIDLSFTRSSGAGGQNVNKVNTKVELRFHVLEADWLPLEVRERLFQQQRSRVNKKGFLSLACQEHRTQDKNRKTAVSKLEQMILEAYPRPTVRKMRKGVSKAAKERKKEFKRKKSQVKQSRGAVNSRDL